MTISRLLLQQRLHEGKNALEPSSPRPTGDDQDKDFHLGCRNQPLKVIHEGTP